MHMINAQKQTIMDINLMETGSFHQGLYSLKIDVIFLSVRNA